MYEPATGHFLRGDRTFNEKNGERERKIWIWKSLSQHCIAEYDNKLIGKEVYVDIFESRLIQMAAV